MNYNTLKLLMFFILLILFGCLTPQKTLVNKNQSRFSKKQKDIHMKTLSNKDKPYINQENNDLQKLLPNEKNPFYALKHPPTFPKSTIQIHLPIPHNQGLDYAAYHIITLPDHLEFSSLNYMFEFALPSYGIICPYSIVISTLKGAINENIVSEWINGVLTKINNIKKWGLWCSYTKCAFVVETCKGTLSLPKSLPGKAKGSVPIGYSYRIIYDDENGNLEESPLYIDENGKFSLLIPPCINGMKFREILIAQKLQGDKLSPMLVGRINCNNPVYFKIFKPQVHLKITNPLFIAKMIFKLVNDFRKLKGVSPLVWNNKLAIATQKYTKFLAQHIGDIRHVIGNSTPVTRAHEEQYYSDGIGENLALTNTILDAVLGWYSSLSHRQELQDTNMIDGAVGVYLMPQNGLFDIYSNLLTGTGEN